MAAKSLLLFLLVFCSQLPWTGESADILMESKATIIFTGQPGYARGECCNFEPASVYINSNCATQDVSMVVLHESQHLLGHLYLSDDGTPLYEYWSRKSAWDRFTPLALSCGKRYAPGSLPLIVKFANLGPWELHAQLPWLMNGRLCQELQPWYPWFDLGDAPTLTDSSPSRKSHAAYRSIRSYMYHQRSSPR